MEVLHLRNRSSGEIQVVDAREHSSVPPGFHGHVLGPGESHLGLPFEFWSRRVGETLAISRPSGRIALEEEEGEEETGPLARSLLIAPGLAWSADLVVRLLGGDPPDSMFRLAALVAGFAVTYTWHVWRAPLRR